MVPQLTAPSTPQDEKNHLPDWPTHPPRTIGFVLSSRGAFEEAIAALRRGALQDRDIVLWQYLLHNACWKPTTAHLRCSEVPVEIGLGEVLYSFQTIAAALGWNMDRSNGKKARDRADGGKSVVRKSLDRLVREGFIEKREVTEVPTKPLVRLKVVHYADSTADSSETQDTTRGTGWDTKNPRHLREVRGAEEGGRGTTQGTVQRRESYNVRHAHGRTRSNPEAKQRPNLASAVAYEGSADRIRTQDASEHAQLKQRSEAWADELRESILKVHDNLPDAIWRDHETNQRGERFPSWKGGRYYTAERERWAQVLLAGLIRERRVTEERFHEVVKFLYSDQLKLPYQFVVLSADDLVEKWTRIVARVDAEKVKAKAQVTKGRAPVSESHIGRTKVKRGWD